MSIIVSINSFVNGIVWGPYMLALLVGTGIFLTVRSGFMQFRHFGTIFKNTVGILHTPEAHKKNEFGVSPFQAVMTALASTVGTGNITGVATAIALGGPGAVFWMWISAVFGMMTKFSEVVLSVHFREKNQRGENVGGPMYYLEKGLHLKQSNAISTALQSTLGINPYLTGAVIVVIAAIVLLGGIQSIAKVTSTLVPIMGCAYAIFAILALIANAPEIPHAFAIIFEGAFHPQSIAGGVAGYTVLMAIRFGVARGVFSNEAGLGSAPIAHAAAVTDSPVKQGFWGAFEVFFDTLVICTLTSLVIVSSGLYNNGMQGADLTIAAFGKAIGPFGTFGVTLATVLFAISTILGWSYYGEKSIEYLFKGKSYTEKLTKGYRAIFVLLAFVGAVSSLTLVWSIADTLNGLMAIPNLIGLLGLNGVIIRLVREFFKEKH